MKQNLLALLLSFLPSYVCGWIPSAISTEVTPQERFKAEGADKLAGLLLVTVVVAACVIGAERGTWPQLHISADLERQILSDPLKASFLLCPHLWQSSDIKGNPLCSAFSVLAFGFESGSGEETSQTSGS